MRERRDGSITWNRPGEIRWFGRQNRRFGL